MYEILKALAAENSWEFEYSPSDISNLYEGLEKKSVSHIFLDPVKIRDNDNDTGQTEFKTYSGSFMILYSSSLDELSYDDRYNDYVKPIIDGDLLTIKNALVCDYEATIKNWDITEVINVFDYNLDGVIVNYSLDTDVELPVAEEDELRIGSRNELTLIDAIAANNSVVNSAEVGMFNSTTSKITWASNISVGLSEWTVAFRGDNYIGSGNDFIVGGATKANIYLNPLNFGFRDSSGVYRPFGVGTPENTKFDCLFYSDGTNIHLILDGNYEGFIAPETTELYFNNFGKGYSGDTLGANGEYSDLRFWKSNVGQQEALKYHTDNMMDIAYLHLDLNGHNYDRNTGLQSGTLTDVSFPLNVNASPLAGLDLGYVDKDGLQIINYALNQSAVSDYLLMHQGGLMHNYIKSYIDFSTMTDPLIKEFFDRSTARYLDPKPDDADKHKFLPTELINSVFQALLVPAFRDIVTIEADAISINRILK